MDALRDWGHAKDYVEMQWLMLQQQEAKDFVIATGKTTQIRDFVKMAFSEIGVELAFRGSEENEEGVVVASNGKYKVPVGQVVVKVDPRYYRPTEVDLLIGDPTKANTQLGWKPKYSLEQMIQEMVASDLNIFEKDQFLKQSGFEVKNEFE
jgi:GDPmannose 4,6-dehydratase